MYGNNAVFECPIRSLVKEKSARSRACVCVEKHLLFDQKSLDNYLSDGRVCFGKAKVFIGKVEMDV